MVFSTEGVQYTLVASNMKQGLDEGGQENGDCMGEVAAIIPIAEEEEVVEMNLSESPADEPTSPIPIEQLSLGQFPEFRQYVRDRAETSKKDNNYCRRLLPLKSKVRAVQRFSELEELRSLEGTFGDPTLFGPSATRTCYTNEGDQKLLEVRLKDYPFLKNTLLIIHKLVAYSSTESPQESNICYLPARSTNDTQVYEIARSTEAPAQVDVQLKTNYAYVEQEDEQPDSQPVAQEYSESPAVNSVAMPCKSEGNASSEVTFTSSAANFLVNPTTIGVSSASPSILQSVCNPNAIIITKANTSHIVSASSLGQTAIITNAPAVIPRELVVQGNTRLVVASASFLEEAMTKSKEEDCGGAKTDVTTDGETSRPGYVTVCHNCGTQSRNFHCCDSCRRTIPRGSRVMSDRLQQSILAGIKVAPGINSTLISPKKSPTRKKRQGKPKPEEITLSSDSDEESCESSPEKKLKLNSDSDANHTTSTNSASIPPQQTTANADEVNNGALKIDEATADDPIDEIAMKDCKAVDVQKVREAILAKIKNSSGSYIKLKCRSFRVGTYKNVDQQLHEDPNFVATISDEGVMFHMPHYSKLNKMEQLVIPNKAILQILACFESRKSPFLILHVGNKIARWIRETLGMTTRTKGWFDPVSGGNSAEKSIVVMVDAFKPEDIAFINRTYSTTVNDVDATRANQILLDIAVESSAALNTTNNTVSSAVVVNSGVQIGKVSTPVVVTRPIDPSKVSSPSSSSKPASCNVIPGIKKSNLRSQQDKQKNGKLAGSKADEDPLIDGTKTILTGKNKKLIPLIQQDLMTLRPEQFLNDQIIDFWLLYVYHHLLSESDRARTHIFGQFFYNRLTQKPRDSMVENEWKKATAAEKRHRRVKNWTKKVDLFSKDFVIVPINDSCHWYVAIICFPGLKGPQWMDDGTPVENWQNLSKESGKPKFTRPPGMPPRVDDLPPKRRKKKPQEGLPNESAAADKPANGVGGSHATDLDGNPILPDEASSEATVPVAGEDGKIPEKQQDKVPVSKGAATVGKDGSKKDNAILAPITPKVAANPTGLAAMLDESAHFDDPFKDEAKDDSDEENLIHEYFYDDESDDEETEEGSENVTESPTAEPPAEEAKTNSVESQESAADKGEKMEVGDGEAVVGDGRKDFRIKQPCILLFNSLFGTARTRVFTTLREYLQVEYKERKGEERQFSKFDMPGFEPNVPQQKNMCDCGVYLFEYVERFFSDPLDSYLLALPSSLRKWFPQLKTKRKDMYDKICDMVKEENPENMKYVPKFDVPPPPPLPPCDPRSVPGKERKADIKAGQCLVAGTISYNERLVKAKGGGGVLTVEKMDTSEETLLKGQKSEIKSSLLPQNQVIAIMKAKGGGGVILKKVGTTEETPAKCRKPASKARVLTAPRIPKVSTASVRKVVVKKVTKKNSLVPYKEECDVSKKGTTVIPITIEKSSSATENCGADATQKGSQEEEPPSTSTVTTPSATTKKASKGRRASSSKPKDEPTTTPLESTDSKSVAPEPAPEATVAQVEAAPRQKLTPVAPEEEPMEIDPVAEES